MSDGKKVGTPGDWMVVGPMDGAGDCYPPEPGKVWLSIEDGNGDEMAIIVRRTPYSVGPEELKRAALIASAPTLAAENAAMREALEGLLERMDALVLSRSGFLGDDHRAIENARAALALSPAVSK